MWLHWFLSSGIVWSLSIQSGLSTSSSIPYNPVWILSCPSCPIVLFIEKGGWRERVVEIVPKLDLFVSKSRVLPATMPARKAERKATTAICAVLPHSCFLKFFLYILLTFWLRFRKGSLILNEFPGSGTFYLIAMCMHYTVANTSVLQPNKIYFLH